MFQVHSSTSGRLIELPDEFVLTVLSTIVDLCFGHNGSPDTRVHTVLRFVRRGGRLHALWQHMDMLDLLTRCHVIRDLVLTPALRAAEFLSGLEVFKPNEAFLSTTWSNPNPGCATGFSVARRQDRADVAYVINGVVPNYFVLWCPYCRMYTVVVRDDRRPRVYPFADAIAVLLFAGGGHQMPRNPHYTKVAQDDDVYDDHVEFVYAHVTYEFWTAARTSEVRDRLRSCCFSRGPLSPVILTDRTEAVHVPRRLLGESLVFAHLPRQSTDRGEVVFQLEDTDAAHLDGLRLMMDALKSDSFGPRLMADRRDIVISPRMTILIKNGLSEQTGYLLRHHDLLARQTPYTVLDNVLSSRRTYSMLSRSLLDARPEEDEQLRTGISHNRFVGEDLVRWNVHLGRSSEYRFTVALRPRNWDLGMDTWIAVLHNSECRFVFERGESTREFWLYVLLDNERSTRNFYVASNPPSLLHTWVPNGGRLLTHMGMLLLAGRVEEGATLCISAYNTNHLGIEFERDVIYKMSQTMPCEAYLAVFAR